MIEILYKLKVTCEVCNRSDIIQKPTQYPIPSLESDLPPNWIRARWSVYCDYGCYKKSIDICPHCGVAKAKEDGKLPKHDHVDIIEF